MCSKRSVMEQREEGLQQAMHRFHFVPKNTRTQHIVVYTFWGLGASRNEKSLGTVLSVCVCVYV